MPLRLPTSLTLRLRPTLRLIPTHHLHRPAATRTYATPTDSIPTTLPPSLVQKFQKSPKVIEQIQTLARLCEAKGFALNRQPTTMEMMKMGMDKEFREEIQKLTELLKEEGMMGDITEVLKGMGK